MQSSVRSQNAAVISRSATSQTGKAAAVNKVTAAKKPTVKIHARMKRGPAAKTAGKRKHVTFQVQTRPGSKVYVGGDFNEWNPMLQELFDLDGNGVYQASIPLEPGVYEYKFHINDTWCVDPANPNFRLNVMKTLNSVIIVE